MGRGVEGSLLGLIEYEEPREPRKAPPLPPEPEDAGPEAPPDRGLGLVIYRRPAHASELSAVSRPETPGPDVDLFQDLVASMPQKRRSWRGFWKSLATHAVTIAAIVLVVVLRPLEPPPETRDYIRALIYDPPPPPPPPLPKGRALTPKLERAKPVSENPELEKPRKEPVMEAPVEAEVKPESRDSASEQFGSETGSDFGVPEGMEGGVEGGVVGGTPGGVLGGVLGGTGTGPVLDYDKPPRLLRQTKPLYPQEAFVKKIEGIVLVEILIDSTGRVARARILQSIPPLDKAALQTVYQWIFSPAVKHGRPVPTIAHVPVGFRIY